MNVAQYSDNVKITVRVEDYNDVLSLMKAIDSMQFSGGDTLTGKALQYIAQHGFTNAPALDDVSQVLPQVVVLLTDSHAQDSLVEAAKYTRGLDVFLIAIGSEFLREELNEITGNSKRTIVYSTPQDLFNKIPELQKKICSIDRLGKDSALIVCQGLPLLIVPD